ncbi:M56 family metallopeptidase [Hymenobacter sp. BT770]|uniref:M56 family metallopeptidase n=1 Tax=Hymenobacter sp. BT770 TaxID=2886942 RepID=UPI001D1095B7|nr:M56 family metallopeptidase [Hymenobacter sp. BT770]MCC3154211.1 M56 family metallopeptidase [Hymenobacter sp. BT770]MDO3414342.1 M56 family metallopeptidase [Hymenobacter sp. BT770]
MSSIYLLKANVALLLFALAYFGLLRRLTFFSLNRFYLLFALLFSAAYPLLPLPALFPAEASLPAAFVLVETSPVHSAVVAGPVAPAVDWEAGGLLLYAGGAAVLLGRLLVQLLSLWQLRRTSRPSVVLGQPIRVLAGAVSPFSFWRTIYLNPLQHAGAELAAVLRHEQVHVRQWHTLDVLLAQVAQAMAWCNPAAWLLRRALLDNLEYLADHAALQTGLDRQAYQYSLLRLSQGVAGPSLVSHFTFPTLKNRVIMMNSPASALAQTGRYLLALPLAVGLAVGVGAALSPAAAAPVTQTAAPGPAVYYLDGKLSDKAAVYALDQKSIAYIHMLDEKQARQAFGAASGAVAIVVTTANQNSAAVLALNEKVDKVAPLVPATPEQKAAIAAAQAYLLKNYPNAKLQFIGPDSKADAAAPRYRAQFQDGGQTKQQYFDAQGQPVGTASASPNRR